MVFCSAPRFPSLEAIKEQAVGSVNHKPSGQDLWAHAHKRGRRYLRMMPVNRARPRELCSPASDADEGRPLVTYLLTVTPAVERMASFRRAQLTDSAE